MHDLFPGIDIENRSNRLLPTFDLDTYRDKNYLTHNLHPYPAKFVPQIPQLLINEFCPPRGVVFDPFCGSGTALLEATLLGHDAVGADLHPLAVLISRVKTKKLSASEFNNLKSFLSNFSLEFSNFRRGKFNRFPVPEFRNREKWFTTEAQTELAAIRARIAEVKNQAVRDVLTVCFSAIIVKASNQESDTRWKAVNKGRERGDTLRFFIEKVHGTIARLSALTERLGDARVRVRQTNAKDAKFLQNEFIDLVVTSPPYMNSYDYYLYHKLRMFWLGFDHYIVQKEEIGSRNKHCDNGQGLDEYTNEIESTMRETRRVLKDDAYAAYVIGDLILKAELIKMDECYRVTAQKVGFKFVEQFSFDQRRYTRAFTSNYKSQTKQSHILLFQAA